MTDIKLNGKNPFESAADGDRLDRWLPPQGGLPEGAQPDQGPGQSSQSRNAASIVALACNGVHNQVYSASKSGIPMGAIVTPLPDLRQAPLVVRHSPVACTSCYAVISKYCQVDLKTGTWRCIFCHQQNVSQALIAESYQPGGMLKSEAVDYVLPPPPGGSSPAPRVVLLLDVACDPPTMDALKSSVLQITAKLPRRTEIMLVTFATSVAVYHLQDSEIAEAECFPGQDYLSSDMLRTLTDAALDGNCLGPLYRCRKAAEQAVASLSPLQSQHGAETKRCIGAAVNTALHLLQQADLRNSQEADGSSGVGSPSMERQPNTNLGRLLIVTTGGPPSEDASPFSLQAKIRASKGWRRNGRDSTFQDTLVQVARAQGTVIDIMTVGMPPRESAKLNKLASATGGILIPQKAFGALFASSAIAALNRRVGVNGILDIHMSSSLKLMQIIGPVSPLDRGPTGMAAQSQSAFLHSNHALEIGAVERGQAIAVSFDVQAPIKSDHVYFQVVISWTAEDRSSVHRVVSRQLQVFNTHQAIVKCLDCEVASLILAKRIVQKAQQTGSATNRKAADRLQVEVGKHLEHIAKMVGQQVDYAAGWFTTKKRWRLPQDLAFLNQALYHLHVSPMLGGLECESEEQIMLQELFLRAAPAIALRLLAPELHLLERGSGQFNLVLPASIALWSDSAALLDTGDRLYIWSGKAMPAGMPDPSGTGTWTRTSVVCERQAARLAAERFPVPELSIVTEGSEEAKAVISRLIPIQNDSLKEQEEQLPVIAFLTEEQLKATLARQEPTEQLSLVQWTQSVGVQPPPPPDNLAEILQGMSAARATSMSIANLGTTQSLANRRQHSQKMIPISTK